MEKKNQYYAKIVSSLVKVFPRKEPVYEPECVVFTALKNETVSFQVAYAHSDRDGLFSDVSVISPIKKNIRIRKVVCVPSTYPANMERDANYLQTTPGMFPDLLQDLPDGKARFTAGNWSSLWVDIEVDEYMPHGTYPIKIVFLDTKTGSELCSVSTKITVYNVVLPESKIFRTEWFHGDCLADYYRVPVFSEEHWAIMKRFITAAVKRSINAILTPQFTPPLDTAKGGERTTIQLVDITVTSGEYSFNFDKLKRWVDICLGAGMKYLEMSHLFTQWGAEAAPKVMAEVDGFYKQIFGWESPAVGGEYTKFLCSYLPCLVSKLKEWGIEERVIFHISDEPRLWQLEAYKAAKDSVSGYLEGFKIVDALSNYEFYKTGTVDNVVVATNYVHEFFEHGVSDIWTYYCTSQCVDVSNRFMSMPSERNRIYGFQLFKYDIKGILHWGYNFYNTQYSLSQINPYCTTDSGGAFPSGDAFLVYPGVGGNPEESVRIMVLDEAMSDLRAMTYLAELKGKEYVMELIEGALSEPITFKVYPKSDYYIIFLRNRINMELNAVLN